MAKTKVRKLKIDVEYEFMDEPVRIIEIYGGHEAVIENRFGSRATVSCDQIGEEWKKIWSKQS